MQLVLERRNDAEITTASAQAPEQVGIFAPAGRQELAIGGDDNSRQKVVAREAISASKPAQATPQGQPRDPGVRIGAACRCQTEGLRLVVKIAPSHASLGP